MNIEPLKRNNTFISPEKTPESPGFPLIENREIPQLGTASETQQRESSASVEEWVDIKSYNSPEEEAAGVSQTEQKKADTWENIDLRGNPLKTSDETKINRATMNRFSDIYPEDKLSLGFGREIRKAVGNFLKEVVKFPFRLGAGVTGLTIAGIGKVALLSSALVAGAPLGVAVFIHTVQQAYRRATTGKIDSKAESKFSQFCNKVTEKMANLEAQTFGTVAGKLLSFALSKPGMEDKLSKANEKIVKAGSGITAGITQLAVGLPAAAVTLAVALPTALVAGIGIAVYTGVQYARNKSSYSGAPDV